MDKYLTLFCEQLDIEVKPETLFRAKEFYGPEWLKRKFTIRRNDKKHGKENSTANTTAGIEYV